MGGNTQACHSMRHSSKRTAKWRSGGVCPALFPKRVPRLSNASHPSPRRIHITFRAPQQKQPNCGASKSLHELCFSTTLSRIIFTPLLTEKGDPLD